MKTKYVSPQITRVKLDPEQAILGMCDEETPHLLTGDFILCIYSEAGSKCKAYRSFDPAIGASGYSCKEARS